MVSTHLIRTLLVFLILLTGQAWASGPANIIGYRSIDIDGRPLKLGLQNKVTPVIMVFLDTGCPISNRYIPELNRLFGQAKAADIQMLGVFAETRADLADIRRYQQEYQLQFPVIFDTTGELADRLKPEVTPEAFVIGTDDDILYRGRIDNRFAAIGQLRNQITARELQDVIGKLGAGQTVKPHRTEAVGCFFEAFKDGVVKQPTYTRHIAPMLNANCVECHSEGGIAPFALADFQDVKRRGVMAAYVAKSGLMPPWRAEKGFGHFRDERHLSKREIETLLNWANTGTPKGKDSELIEPVKPADVRWRMGKPSLELTMTEPFKIPAEGKDIYRYFVIPSGMVKRRDLVGIDFKPGNPAVVHHANFFVDYGGRGRALDAKDKAPGFSVFGTGGFMNYDTGGAFGAWAPGVEPYRLPEGLGMDFYPGGDIVIEIHYHLSGKATSDQSTIALYFADEPVKTHVQGLFLGTQDVAIPAGEKDYRRHIWMHVPADMTLIDLSPHMHYIGKTAKVEATLPDGSKVPLVNVTDWDIRWQNVYIFRKPVKIPKGSRIDVWFSFDNSAENPANPFHPPKPMDWGWASDEEMAELYVTMIPDNPKDYDKLVAASRASWVRPSDPAITANMTDWTVADAQSLFNKMQSVSLWSDEGEQVLQQALYADAFEALITLYEKASVNYDADTLAKYGVLLASATGLTEDEKHIQWLTEAADKAFDAALQADPTHWDASFSKAYSYAQWPLEYGLATYAEQIMTELIAYQKTQPKQAKFAKVWVYLGDLYQKQGNQAKAKSTWQEGLKHHPNSLLLKQRVR